MIRFHVRIAALLSLLLLAAGCGEGNLLPPAREATGSWTSRSTVGTGGGAVTNIDNLSLYGDGTFRWTNSEYGDGAGRPDAPMRLYSRKGQYRIRDGFLEIRTEVTEYSRTPGFLDLEQAVVQNPQWSGDQYRMVVEGDNLVLRYTVAPADAPIEVTQVFRRDRPID